MTKWSVSCGVYDLAQNGLPRLEPESSSSRCGRLARLTVGRGFAKAELSAGRIVFILAVVCQTTDYASPLSIPMPEAWSWAAAIDVTKDPVWTFPGVRRSVAPVEGRRPIWLRPQLLPFCLRSK